MDDWDAQKILDMYIHDYMKRKNMHKTAEIFAREANVAPKDVVINPPDGFLTEWWSIFWDIFSHNLQNEPENGEEDAEAAANIARNFGPLPPRPEMNPQAFGSMLQSLSFMMPKPEMNQQTCVMQPPTPNPAISPQMFAEIPDMLQGEPVSTLLAKMYEQECLRRSARDFANEVQQLDVPKMHPMLASSSKSSYLPQQNAENVQQWLGREDKRAVSFEKSDAVAPTPQEASQALLPIREISDAGKNKGVQQIPAAVHPMTGVGLVSPDLRNQVSHSFVTLPDQQRQFPPSGGNHMTVVGLVSTGLRNQVSRSLVSLPNQQQQFAPSVGHYQVDSLPALAEQKSENLISSASGSSHNPATPMLDLNGKDLQMPHDAKVVGGKKTEKQAPVGQTVPEKQKNDMPMQQNANESVRKRKKESSSLAVDSTLDGKDAEMEKSIDEEIEAYLSQEHDNTNDMATQFRTLKQNSPAYYTNEPEGFSFKEVGSLHSSNNKLLCCHFSSSGKLLAAAGHEKKVLLWNMENYSVHTIFGHSDIITDIRFRPNSTVFATSSFDKTVLVWDAAERSKPLFMLTGHSEHVMSLDFHPKKLDLLCSCDSGHEIRFWGVNSCYCSYISKGAGSRGRFQPQMGNLLAAAKGNYINLIDIETKRITCQLQGHIKDIRSLCWDSTGKYIASVSEDSARMWSIDSGGHSIHVLPCGGNTFASCTFHPGYCQLLVMGSNQSIQFWNPTENNRIWSYQAHDSTIAALAESPYTETLASASHDQWLKVWK